MKEDEIELKLTTINVNAKPKKLNISWSKYGSRHEVPDITGKSDNEIVEIVKQELVREAEPVVDDIFINGDVEEGLVKAAAQELSNEIDKEVICILKKNCSN